MQAGDVEETWVDVTEITENFGYIPCIDIAILIKKLLIGTANIIV